MICTIKKRSVPVVHIITIGTFLFYYLYKSKHFIRAIVGIVLFVFEHTVFVLKILTPELVDLKSAFVYVEMDISLLKVRSTGFPNLCFGVQSFNRLPRAVANAFAVCLG